MKKIIIFFSLFIFLLGCGVSTKVKMSFSVLRVQNNSLNDVFVSLVSNDCVESFGGIPPGNTKTKGFSPIYFGDETVVQYSEDTIDERNRFVISTKEITNFKGQIDEIIFRYLGNDKWVLILLDTKGHEVTFD